MSPHWVPTSNIPRGIKGILRGLLRRFKKNCFRYKSETVLFSINYRKQRPKSSRDNDIFWEYYRGTKDYVKLSRFGKTCVSRVSSESLWCCRGMYKEGGVRMYLQSNSDTDLRNIMSYLLRHNTNERNMNAHQFQNLRKCLDNVLPLSEEILFITAFRRVCKWIQYKPHPI